MVTDVWLESATTTLASILATDHGLCIDRALLATMLDRRRAHLARALGLTEAQVEPMLSAGELRDIARLMAHAQAQHHVSHVA